MEFPHLGQHCNEKSCNKLDFLPMQCDACRRTFCSTHFHYEQHKCSSGVRKDYQVPLCPLCGEPVPTPPNVEPDLTVSQHIDRQCKSESQKVFTNRCSHINCKRKELIPVQCSQCKRNYCLRHRHSSDHDCQATPTNSKLRTKAAIAAELRRSEILSGKHSLKSKPDPIINGQPLYNGTAAATALQGHMSEDEAMARAIALSIMELDKNNQANRQAETNAQTTNCGISIGGQGASNTNNKEKCSLS